MCSVPVVVVLIRRRTHLDALADPSVDMAQSIRGDPGRRIPGSVPPGLLEWQPRHRKNTGLQQAGGGFIHALEPADGKGTTPARGPVPAEGQRAQLRCS
jgi:hypothetical protein